MIRVEVKDEVIEMLVTLKELELDKGVLSKEVENAIVQYVCLLLESDDDNELDPAKVSRVEELVSEYWKEN